MAIFVKPSGTYLAAALLRATLVSLKAAIRLQGEVSSVCFRNTFPRKCDVALLFKQYNLSTFKLASSTHVLPKPIQLYCTKQITNSSTVSHIYTESLTHTIAMQRTLRKAMLSQTDPASLPHLYTGSSQDVRATVRSKLWPSLLVAR